MLTDYEESDQCSCSATAPPALPATTIHSQPAARQVITGYNKFIYSPSSIFDQEEIKRR